jgi:serine/threonine protein kinase
VHAELESASRVLHPGVARVYGVNRGHDGTVYIAQELVDGRSLRQHMDAAGPAPSLGAVAPVIADIAHALAALHAGGVVHRDLKPENVILNRDHRPVLIDFGIAQTAEGGAVGIVGTPGYMAPEQLRGRSVDARADIYALGVIAYEWLTGNKPRDMSHRGVRARVERWLHSPRRVLRQHRPDLTRPVGLLVARMLRTSPERRPETAERVAARFDEFSERL